MARSTTACVIGRLGEAAARVSEAEADEIFDILEGRRFAREGAGIFGDEDQRILDDAARAARELKLTAAVTRRQAALNVIVYRKLHQMVAAFDAGKSSAGKVTAPRSGATAEAGTLGLPAPRKAGGMNDVLGLEAILASSNRRNDYARASVDALYRGRINKYVLDLFTELKGAGVESVLEGRKIVGVHIGPGFRDDKLAIELWELTSPKGRPGITGDPEVLKAAKIIHKYLELARHDQNRHGAYIQELRGYIANQSHQAEKLARAGYEQWRNDVWPRLDIKRTFGEEFMTQASPAALENALRGIYDNLASGRVSREMPTGPVIEAKGEANLAKAVSQHRVLHFKTPADWMFYNTTYGYGSLLDAVVATLDHAAKTAALLERLGPNPRQMFERIRGDLVALNASDPKVVQRLRSKHVDALLDAADGSVDQLDSPAFAVASSIVRTVQTQAALGSALLSSINDLPVQAARLSLNGVNFFEALGQQVSGFVGNNREIAEHLGFGVQAIVTDMASRFHGNDSMQGWLGKSNQIFFKANGLHTWDRLRSRAFVATLGSHLFANRGNRWAQLPSDLRASLAAYGITDRDWDLIRVYGALDHPGGGGVISGEPLRHIPENVMLSHISREGAGAAALDRARDALESKLRSYYGDQLAWATLQPGVREKAMTTQGQHRGTVMGEAARSFFLFKQYPVMFWQRVIGSLSQEDHHVAIAKGLLALPKSDAVRLAGVVSTVWGLGYISMVLKDLAKGRTPRDPKDPATWGAAFLQGGGAGIYGDFLFGQANRYGSSPLATFGGPVAGDAEAVYKLYNQIIHGDDFGTELYNVAKQNTPYVNLFYARAAIDYLILFRIQEWLRRGSLRRMESRLKKEQGQTYLLPPSQVVH